MRKCRWGQDLFEEVPVLFYHFWATTCDFQQCGILSCVDSDEPLQLPNKLRNSIFCSVSSLTLIEYSSDYVRLCSDCAYEQADLRLCWSHIPHCWKSHVTAWYFIIFMCVAFTCTYFYKQCRKTQCSSFLMAEYQMILTFAIWRACSLLPLYWVMVLLRVEGKE